MQCCALWPNCVVYAPLNLSAQCPQHCNSNRMEFIPQSLDPIVLGCIGLFRPTSATNFFVYPPVGDVISFLCALFTVYMKRSQSQKLSLPSAVNVMLNPSILCPTLASWWSDHLSHFIAVLKINHPCSLTNIFVFTVSTRCWRPAGKSWHSWCVPVYWRQSSS